MSQARKSRGDFKLLKHLGQKLEQVCEILFNRGIIEHKLDAVLFGIGRRGKLRVLLLDPLSRQDAEILLFVATINQWQRPDTVAISIWSFTAIAVIGEITAKRHLPLLIHHEQQAGKTH